MLSKEFARFFDRDVDKDVYLLKSRLYVAKGHIWVVVAKKHAHNHWFLKSRKITGCEKANITRSLFFKING